jgi:hypothetical protein
MLTREVVLEAINNGRESACIDLRDYSRLCRFFPPEQAVLFGLAGANHINPLPWTEEAIKAELSKDLDFAFEKALDRRGLSADAMTEVVQMWAWILEVPEIAESEDYAYYGLPILKAAAIKFGLQYPIGDDTGRELKYSSR